jgi:hypothetical protein
METTEQSKSSWWKLQAILFQPKGAYEAIDQRPNWLLPLLITTVLSLGMVVLMTQTIGMDAIMRAQMAASPRGQEATPEQIEMGAKVARVMMWVAGLLGTAIATLVSAGVFALILSLAGASQAGFRKIFSVVNHGFLAYSVVTTILSALVILLAPDPTELDITNLVAANLGPLVDRKESAVLFTVLASLDLTSFYLIFLLALGLSTVARRKLANGILWVVIPWLLYLGLKVGAAWIGARMAAG